MAAINKYRYLQAIFVGIPMGLASLYYGSIALFDIQQNVNDYQNFYGVVDSVYVDYFKTSERSKHISEVLCVKVNNNVCYLTYGKHRDIIESHIYWRYN
jgi:MFS superfamily sulfate permease-like transporter